MKKMYGSTLGIVARPVLAITAAFSACFFCCDSDAAVLRVKPSGNDASSGATWEQAKRTIGNALTAAAEGDQIWVAAGIYNEAVVMKNGVALYGGFAGLEATLTERDWALSSSVINAQGTGKSAVTVPSGTGPNTRVDGLVITGGSSVLGGGVSLTGSAAVIANNCIKWNVTTGGAGGGICILGSFGPREAPTHSVITNNAIVRNTCISQTALDGNGGGIAIFASSPLIAWNTIARNAVYMSGGGIASYCGLTKDFTADTCPVIANNVIEGNTAACDEAFFMGEGGAIQATAAAMNGSPCGTVISSPLIVNNVIAANGAGGAGGIFLHDSIFGAATVVNNTIIANSDAGIHWHNTSPRVCNNLIGFNRAGLQQSGSGTATLRANNVFGNIAAGLQSDYLGLPSAIGVDGNFSAEPRLANYRVGDFHLQPDSPCVDAGLTVEAAADRPDADGRPRVSGAAVDVGAYESSGATWSATVPILHVRTNGNDNNDGLTWATARRTVQAAVDALAPDPRIGGVVLRGGEVWVAQGTYIGQITLPAFTHLYGGFAGDETARSARNPASHPTMLNGGGASPVVHSQHGGNLVSTLDGYTVRNGVDYTSGRLDWLPGNHPDAYGGGIYCGVSSPIIANNLISSNSPGSPSGTAESSGVGIYCYLGHAQITGNNITDNELLNSGTSKGAGIGCRFSSPLISSNMIARNHSSEGSAIHAMYYGRPQIVGNIIRDNWMYSAPPNYFGSFHGAVTLMSINSVVLEGNLVQGNVADQGAGVYLFTAFAGGVIQNNLVISNRGSSIMPLGGGMSCHMPDLPSNPLQILNNTFMGNSAKGNYTEYGGAMEISSSGAAAMTIANNIIVSNSSGILKYTGSATQNLRNNCLYSNGPYDYAAVSGGLTPGATDLHLDPLLVNPPSGNFRLSTESPCIDAASEIYAPASDKDGVSRPLDGNCDGVCAPDIGAFEFADSSADSDGDGVNDASEVVAGTNPVSATSLLKLRTQCVPAQNAVALEWDSVMGRNYCVQFMPTLTAGWQTLSNNIAGCGASIVVHDPLIGGGNRFYRLEVTRE